MAENPINLLDFMGRESLPLIRQNEATECGNACLAMVAGAYGYKTDIAGLRRRFPTSARGMTLRMLAENAGRLGFAARPLKAEVGQLGKLHLPAILHWDLNHFVVLKSVGRGKAVVYDPAKGARKLDLEELGEHYTGVVLELTPTGSFEKHDERARLKFSSLWSKLRGLGSSLVQILLLSVVLQAYVLAAPQYLQIVIDTVLPASDSNLLLTLTIGFGLFLIVNVLTTIIRGLVILYAGSSMSYQIAINLFSHLVRLPLPFFERRHIGDIVSRFGSITPIQNFLTQGVATGIIDGLMALITLALMFTYSTLLAVVSVVALLIYLALRLAMLRAFRNATEEAIIASATEQSNFMESVRGILTIKAFGRENMRVERWQNLLADTVNQGVRVERLNIAFGAASALIQGLSQVVVVYLAARMVIEAEFTVGMIFAFMAYRAQFMSTTIGLVELLIEARMLGLHLDRLSDITTADQERQGGEPLSLSDGRIVVRNLSFSYEPQLPTVLRDVSFDVVPGECVALTGPSGGGKTTLLKLMMGLIQPRSGDIHVDGIALSRIDPGAYRGQIASVMQDDTLFSGSIAENISFFDTDMDMRKVHEVVTLACLDQDIAKMPMGYETMVGDMGSSLSGGQVQRVLLARALYQSPQILFMDEGTSHLDVGTEQAVNTAIRTLGITRVIVAHRPQTIAMADRALKFKDGMLEEVPVGAAD